MWPFASLFGGKKNVEGFAAEAEQVLADQADIIKIRQSLFPQNKEDSRQKLRWYRGRIPILENKRYHPVARLSFSDRYDLMVEDFIKKLKQAEAGDKAAIDEVEAIRSKAPNLIRDELDYLKFKEAKWENISKKAQELAEDKLTDWPKLKEKAEKELAQEREKFEMASPKNKEDMSQWRSYYQQRVARLELNALSPVARLIWVTSMKKEEVERRIQTYLELLDRLIRGEHLEGQLHTIEKYVEIIVINEGIRLHRDYARFLQKPSPIVDSRVA